MLENLFPVLYEGLEELSKEVEHYMEDKDKIPIEVRRRYIYIIKKNILY